MKPRYVKSDLLLQFQRRAWYLITFWFGAVTVLYILGFGAADLTALIGVLAVLATVGGSILIVGELFRKAKLYRYWLLTYLLLLILLSTIVMKTYFGA